MCKGKFFGGKHVDLEVVRRVSFYYRFGSSLSSTIND